MKCQPAVCCQRARQMFCLCFFELNQLNGVLHGKCLMLQAELSGTSLGQNFRLHKVSSEYSVISCVGEKLKCYFQNITIKQT